ncbi:MAG TPA: hypothetical protein VL588_10005 [Bdellovibrionota bacterium]|jgi:hypothetical protein|nr:hypothetical protein [Bdellovibrionota bacterium]
MKKQLHLTILTLALTSALAGGCESPASLKSADGGRVAQPVAEPLTPDPLPQAAEGAPLTGSKAMRAGLGWKTDGPGRANCRLWVKMEWNPSTSRYENAERLVVPADRPRKSWILVDASPWPIKTDVSGSAQAIDAQTGRPVGRPIFVQSAGHNYGGGPQVALVTRDGMNDLLRSRSHPDGDLDQDLDISVTDPAKGEFLFQARLRLTTSEDAHAPCVQ